EPRSPYKGLRPFTQADAVDFFGRERLVEELIQRVHEMTGPEQLKSAQERLLTVLEPSGSGKSSVVLAGLLPQLQQGKVLGSQQWVFLPPMMPGNHPLESLALTLAPHLSSSLGARLREALLDKAASALHRLALEIIQDPAQKVILCIDQFEEIFASTA